MTHVTVRAAPRPTADGTENRRNGLRSSMRSLDPRCSTPHSPALLPIGCSGRRGSRIVHCGCCAAQQGSMDYSIVETGGGGGEALVAIDVA